MKALYVLLIAILIAGCAPSAQQMTATNEAAQAQTQTAAPTSTPTLPPTITPTSTPAYTPTPEFTEVYESESIGVSVRHPAGWDVSEEEIQISFEQGDKKIAVIFFPADVQDQYNDNPVTALTSFIQFSGIAMPDKERVHLTSLNGSQYAIGVYSNPGEALGFNNPSPLFAAMQFTDEFTIYSEMYTPAGDEDGDRQLFELVLASLPPSIPINLVATPTIEPNVSTGLPALPEGYNWQGVEGIDFALPIPDGWYVTHTRNYESYQGGGLKEFDYDFTITQENPDLVGSFSPSLGGMSVWTFSRSDTDAADRVREISSNVESSSMFTIVEMQHFEQGNVIGYQYYIEGIDSDTDPDDPDYYRSLSLIILANTKTNTFYFIYFESPTYNWDEEWKTGQVLVDALLELLGVKP